MKNIISVSRRTDIPAHYYNWFKEQIAKGYVDVPNPLYPEKVSRISLKSEDISCIVLWSKNFENYLKDIENNDDFLNLYNLYFQYTITGYNNNLEPTVPSYEKSIDILKGLVKKFKTNQFNIRFDPIIITNNGELHPCFENPFKARLNAFEKLLNDLEKLNMQDCRVTTSYISFYGNTETKLKKANIDYIKLTEKEQIDFMKEMSIVAKKYNRNIYTCANDKFVNAGIENILKGHCIDGDLLKTIFDEKYTKSKDKSQRLECGCVKSRDIGLYTQKCYHNCAYCYAMK